MKPEVDLGRRTIDLVFCKGWLFQKRNAREEWSGGGVRREGEKGKTTDRLAFDCEGSVGTWLARAAVSMDV